MTRIAIFCDGTWNDPNDPNPTNVHWLAQSVAAQASGTTQKALYYDGVGVQENKFTGGIWGRGLDDKVEEAYRGLCENYQPGDGIYLFGFSRGAYTARSLAGLIRKCGIVAKDKLDKVPRAMEVYRMRDGGPDSEQAQAFRNAYACACVDGALLGITRALARPEDAQRMLRIDYIGVWDTVGALGVPERVWFSKHVNKKHRFHDCDLSRCVEWARHALAIDETRNAFEPAPWTQTSVEDLNKLHKEFRAEQDWFPGGHGAVGGGGPERRLSDAALLWIMEGAQKAGLVFDDHNGHLQRARENAEPVNAPLRNTDKRSWLMTLRGEGPRTKGLPQVPVDLSEGALRRMSENQSYLGGDSQEVRWRRTTLAKVIESLRLGGS